MSQSVKILWLDALNGQVLSNEQIMHAATDSIKSLEVYFKTHTLQDLSLRLEKNQHENNLKVDVVAPHGNIDTVLSTAAVGYLTDTIKINNPPMMAPEKCKVGKNSVIVKI